MDPISLFPRIYSQKKLESLLERKCLDYLCFRCVYLCWDGTRATGTILRDWKGGLTVRRVTPGHVETSTDLHGWVEVYAFLDLESTLIDWYKDQDEEERYRSLLRDQTRELNG